MPGPMLYSQFQKLISTSANQYFDYLTERFNNGVLSSGTKTVYVSRIKPAPLPSEFLFFTNENVLYPDVCQIWIRKQLINSISIICVQRISKSNYMLRIEDRDHFLSTIPSLVPGDIQIISDLRFLISRLNRFYQNNPLNFIPPTPEEILPLPNQFISSLSDEQKNSIEQIFHSSVSYISGAPGTGKTKAVLSRCILRYMISQKCVLLLAPTNNAVEQMLRGILPILQDAGIDLEKVYRLGTSSAEFAAEFPQVIGDSALETMQESLYRQQTYCEEQIKKAEELKISSLKIIQNYELCQTCHKQIKPLFSELLNLENNFQTEKEACNKLSELISSYQKERDAAREKDISAFSVVSSCQRDISRLQSDIHSLRFKFWRNKHRRYLTTRLETMTGYLSQKLSEQTATSLSLQQAEQNLRNSNDEYLVHINQFRSLSQERDNLIHRIQSFSSSCPDYNNVVVSCLSGSVISFDAAEAFMTAFETSYKDALSKDSGISIDSYKSELASIKAQLDNIGRNSRLHQKDNALVIAATIDSALVEISFRNSLSHQNGKDKRFSHVFLDEAGYTSIARGMVAFSCNAPITFLGDHKQLPPVCEMNKISEDFSPVCLWALPIAYSSELLYHDLPYLYHECYIKCEPPSFSHVDYFSLNTSYRFGPLLADILARYIYTPDFRGVAVVPFEILVIDIPTAYNSSGRQSQQEAQAIKTYLSHNPQESISILAPYRDQIKCLRSILPLEYKENILTVHRSQGCEWDTVILSVTDSSNPYFTNSKLTIGKSVINTAISRAKKRLILVCDVDAWEAHPSQMITELIHSGTKISPRP